MTDYAGEQEMEIEALRAILMDDFEEVDDATASALLSEPSTSGATWYRITISPKGDDEDEPTEVPVRLGLFFVHTPQYPDEKPRICAKSMQGVRQADVDEFQAKLLEEAEANLGMAMMYTLATSAKEWLREKYGQSGDLDQGEEEEEKEEVIEAHGEPVTVQSFMVWRERFDAELALERAKLMPESALGAAKEKRLTGRQWFAQRALKGTAAAEADDEEEDEEELDLDEDFDDDDIDEDELLDELLEEKGER